MNKQNSLIVKKLMSALFFLLFPITMNAQELKVYTGPFSPLKGGQVTYQYRDAPDGSRIFEGTFEFYRSGKDYLRIKGQFKNDRQIGDWTWEYNNRHVVSITFYDNGCKFECQGLGRTSQSYIKGTIGIILRERSITSYDLYDAGIGRILRMKWDSDGEQDGPWYVKMDSEHPLYKRDKMGGKWYYVSESTGDKVESSDIWGLQSAMDAAEEWAWSELRPCFMRSTFKK